MGKKKQKKTKRKQETIVLSGQALPSAVQAMIWLKSITADTDFIAAQKIARDALEIDNDSAIAKEAVELLESVTGSSDAVQRRAVEQVVTLVSAVDIAALQKTAAQSKGDVPGDDTATFEVEGAEVVRQDLLAGTFRRNDYRYYVSAALRESQQEHPDYHAAYYLLLQALYLNRPTGQYIIRSIADTSLTVIYSLQIIILAQVDGDDLFWQARYSKAVLSAIQQIDNICRRWSERNKWALVQEARTALRPAKKKRKKRKK